MTKSIADITFTRSDLASIMNCSTLTIGNREKAGKYPEPKRNPNNNYRYYSVQDVLSIQFIEKGVVNLAPVIAKLHDKGITDFDSAQKELRSILEQFQLSVNQKQTAE